MVWISLALVAVAVAVIVILQLIGTFGGGNNPNLQSPPSVPDYSQVTPKPGPS